MSKAELENWVRAAKENNFVIIYDSAYETYITEPDVPHSIFEVEGAKDVAIELRSYSKCAGFTGTRQATSYVVPHASKPIKPMAHTVGTGTAWNRRQCTSSTVRRIIQRAARSDVLQPGRTRNSARLMSIITWKRPYHPRRPDRSRLHRGVYGAATPLRLGVQTPNGMKSWDFFDLLLEKAHVVTTPGSGFGPHGEGYLRLTAFGTRENTLAAVKRIADLHLIK